MPIRSNSSEIGALATAILLGALGLSPSFGCQKSGEPGPASSPAPVVVPAPVSDEDAGTQAQPAPADAATHVANRSPFASCDDYLDLYARCEAQLQPEIAAGNRRSYRAERARIEHLETTPEAATLDDGCAEMLRELRSFCEP
jgi:hypothetical protein